MSRGIHVTVRIHAHDNIARAWTDVLYRHRVYLSLNVVKHTSVNTLDDDSLTTLIYGIWRSLPIQNLP
jgi:hypothetical protein